MIEPFSFNLNTIGGESTAKVLCTVTAGDLPIEIKWLKNGELLASEHNRRILLLDDVMVMLTLSALSVNDSGNYTCWAKNSAGEATYTTSLYVKGVWKGVFFIFFYHFIPSSFPKVSSFDGPL